MKKDKGPPPRTCIDGGQDFQLGVNDTRVEFFQQKRYQKWRQGLAGAEHCSQVGGQGLWSDAGRVILGRGEGNRKVARGGVKNGLQPGQRVGNDAQGQAHKDKPAQGKTHDQIARVFFPVDDAQVARDQIRAQARNDFCFHSADTTTFLVTK